MAGAVERDALDDIVRQYGHAPCDVCDWLVWIDDYRSGDTLCARCGAVQDRLSVAAPNYKDLFDAHGNRRSKSAVVQSYPVGACVSFDAPKVDYNKVRDDLKKRSPPYKRATYLNERLKQWQCTEPPIGDKDWGDIYEVYYFAVQNGTYERQYVLKKEDIRVVLKSLDDKRIKRGKRPRFVRKYLVSSLSSFPASRRRLAWLSTAPLGCPACRRGPGGCTGGRALLRRT